MFDSGSPVDFSFAQPSDVAAVLKYFLRELPEPLLTFDLHHNFIDIPGTNSSCIIEALNVIAWPRSPLGGRPAACAAAACLPVASYKP